MKYFVKLKKEDGTPVKGAQITAKNKNAWVDSSRFYYNQTGIDGTCFWANLDTGFYRDSYLFEARYMDGDNELIAKWSDRLNPNIGQYEKEVVMRKRLLMEYNLEDYPNEVITFLKIGPFGDQIDQVLFELKNCIEKRLNISSVLLGVYIIEAELKTYLKFHKEDEGNFINKPFGELLKLEKIKTILNQGILDKLEAINKFRKSAVHPKGADTAIEEAIIAMKLGKEVGKILVDSIPTATLSNTLQSNTDVNYEE